VTPAKQREQLDLWTGIVHGIFHRFYQLRNFRSRGNSPSA
jgi:hypothetical protein